MLLGVQLSDANVVNNFFHFLDVVLETVKSLSQGVVFEVEKAEAGVKVHQERVELQRSVEITQNDAVHCQP